MKTKRSTESRRRADHAAKTIRLSTALSIVNRTRSQLKKKRTEKGGPLLAFVQLIRLMEAQLTCVCAAKRGFSSSYMRINESGHLMPLLLLPNHRCER